MKTLKFKVELLSDIILNEKAASEGPNKTLDFIPGSNFLGIAAGALYASLKPEESLSIFHSGRVRFGDAHLGADGKRGHKVPAAMFHPKLEKASETLYISHLIPNDEETQQKMRETQLKQCRYGFYDFTKNPAKPIAADTDFAIKSAHDIETRTSRKSMMYGYESLLAGSIMYFEVEVDDECYADRIRQALVGEKRVGRSRSAQYGLVRISSETFEEVMSREGANGEVVVYADSRLIFLDKSTGLPTFRPSASDLGLSGGEVDWERSQIRTFQYSPWNFKRQCFDADRCGIEKGSVIVVKDASGCPSATKYVGCYRNEGFGRVIFNPTFLEAKDRTGIARTTLAEQQKETSEVCHVEEMSDSDSELMKFLKTRNKEEEEEKVILSQVNDWVETNGSLFKGKAFASQWGAIRSMASKANFAASITDLLFAQDTGYLMHGVAKEKWSEHGRIKALRSFVSMFGKERELRRAIVNLASEMAKECGKEDRR